MSTLSRAAIEWLEHNEKSPVVQENLSSHTGVLPLSYCAVMRREVFKEASELQVIITGILFAFHIDFNSFNMQNGRCCACGTLKTYPGGRVPVVDARDTAVFLTWWSATSNNRRPNASRIVLASELWMGG